MENVQQNMQAFRLGDMSENSFHVELNGTQQSFSGILNENLQAHPWRKKSQVSSKQHRLHKV